MITCFTSFQKQARRKLVITQIKVKKIVASPPWDLHPYLRPEAMGGFENDTKINDQVVHIKVNP